LNLNALYTEARKGSRAAEEKLFGHLSVSFRLFTQQRIWNDSDVEEIVQDALMTITGKYKTIDIESSFGGWAYRVLKNKIMDFVKIKQIRGDLLSVNSEKPPVSSNPDPELKAKLMDCFHKIARVNQRHARILNLHYQGYTTGEICEKLGLTPNQFYVTLSRARAMLEFCLEKGDIQ